MRMDNGKRDLRPLLFGLYPGMGYYKHPKDMLFDCSGFGNEIAMDFLFVQKNVRAIAREIYLGIIWIQRIMMPTARPMSVMSVPTHHISILLNLSPYLAWLPKSR